MSLETKNKISKALKEKEYVSEEMSARAKKGNTIRWADPTARRRQSINSPNKKHVIKYDKDLNFIAEFCSIYEAARSINKTHQNISACALGKIKTAYGFIWKFKN